MPNGEQTSRQRLLPEVGARGQTLIERSTAVLPSGAVGDVAAVYVSRSGAAVERCLESPEQAFVHAASFRHRGPAELAAGAHRALLALRETLGVGAPRPRQRVLFP